MSHKLELKILLANIHSAFHLLEDSKTDIENTLASLQAQAERVKAAIAGEGTTSPHPPVLRCKECFHGPDCPQPCPQFEEGRLNDIRALAAKHGWNLLDGPLVDWIEKAFKYGEPIKGSAAWHWHDKCRDAEARVKQAESQMYAWNHAWHCDHCGMTVQGGCYHDCKEATMRTRLEKAEARGNELEAKAAEVEEHVTYLEVAETHHIAQITALQDQRDAWRDSIKEALGDGADGQAWRPGEHWLEAACRVIRVARSK